MGCSKDLTGKIREYIINPEEVFKELGFKYVCDDCDGFCPECKEIMKCVAYKEMKDAWEIFYM